MRLAWPRRGGRPGEGGDQVVSTLSIVGFSHSLGASGLVLPLLAVASGYDEAAVGLLAAVSAISHLAFRLWLPSLLTRLPDRRLIVAANVMMVVSFLILLAYRDLSVFVAAQLLQGAGRALFWTASQTHAVRGGRAIVRSLAAVQAVGNVGQLVGPVIAGVLAAGSLEAALLFCTAAALVGLGAGLAMANLPTFPRQQRAEGQQRIWRRPGVNVACWASYSAGGWRAMLSSLVPVGLAAGGQPPEVIGVLMMGAEATGLGATTMLMRYRPPRVPLALQLAALLVAGSLITFPFVSASALLAGLALGIGGIGSGLLTGLGPALASESVSPEERGSAIVVAGTFRAVALLVAPGAAAAALSVVALPVGLAVAGVVIGAPPIIAGLRRRGAPPPATGPSAAGPSAAGSSAAGAPA